MENLDKRAVRIAAIFFTISFIWILYSDVILLSFIKDPENLTHAQTYKGWFYIFAASFIIYILVKKEIKISTEHQKELENERIKYKTLFDNANDAIFILDSNSRFIDCNRRTLELFNCEKDQIIGKTLYAFSPEYQINNEKSLEVGSEKIELVKRGFPQKLEWKFLQPDKKIEIYTEVSINYIEIKGDENESNILVLVRDITKRKISEVLLNIKNERYRALNTELIQAEEELRTSNKELILLNNKLKESEERFRKYYYNMPIPTYTWKYHDGEFYLTEFNNAAYEITKGEVKNQIGINVNDYFKNQPEIIKNYHECFKNRNVIRKVVPYSTSSKKDIVLDLTFTFVPPDNVIVHSEDITEKYLVEKELIASEEKYKAQFNYFPVPVLAIKKVGDDLIFSDGNKAAELYPYLNLKEIIGKSIKDFFYKKEEAALVKFFDEIYTTKKTDIIEVKYDFKTSGISRDINGIAGFVPPDTILLTIVDITDKKQQEQKIYQAMVDAEERERSRIAKELHDGVSPILSAIKLYIHALFNSTDQKTKNELADKIYFTINEAIQSASDISNKLSPHILQNFGLVTAIQSYIEKIADTTKLSINFSYNLKEKLDENIEINMYRIVVELINNMLKYADAQKSEIVLTERDEILNMYFEHNGKGFNLEDVKKESRGMGIRNIYNRVNSLNGKIDINSSIDKGVKVNITIPLAK